ncbi:MULTISPECIES: hypothetical protein [Haloferax]|uniref:Uncharacterized protein n=1 Tax=Haloferax marinum TaxID=2666143 RepID=A0A6A8GBK0_9EURY|nr:MULTISPECIES: hypothetical protein [Haloferax]KAB1191156.1 hypothetical protein Hfx1150_15860 [Haloferax sp. CBA1150]MRW98042.1 hypothetical protein [Haloferax marinum]
MTLGLRLIQFGGRPPRDTRAQTGLDFVVGVGLFLLVLGFLVQFVPGMIAPYSDDAELPVVAERVATQLTEVHLGSSTAPGELDATDTVAFFTGSNPNSLLAELEDDGYSVNVTAEGNVVGAPTNPLTVGETPPQDGSVAVVRRVVSIEGEDVLFTVRVWR